VPDGRPRSDHVVPRSMERNRRVPPKDIQTTSPDGALIVAFVGNTVRVGVGVPGAVVAGAVVGLGVEVRVDAAGVLTVGDGALAGDEHALAISRKSARKLPGWTRWRITLTALRSVDSPTSARGLAFERGRIPDFLRSD